MVSVEAGFCQLRYVEKAAFCFHMFRHLYFASITYAAFHSGKDEISYTCGRYPCSLVCRGGSRGRTRRPPPPPPPPYNWKKYDLLA